VIPRPKRRDQKTPARLPRMFLAFRFARFLIQPTPLRHPLPAICEVPSCCDVALLDRSPVLRFTKVSRGRSVSRSFGSTVIFLVAEWLRIIFPVLDPPSH